ncbi:SMI1 / KNR4 family protein [Pirellulimonas nuda]|uniref:SMI1 / KNR4 family protein n=1 Tax=Pirellulimonas nuda TaxID=2528009 RepID=A0A518D5X8_9BACT|nr:SMI1/KNR4 family protein [Pirellulimonas nuda]QDU86878.1 SMI1 / KNR4 family protein [Pirellulimonas nuda]
MAVQSWREMLRGLSSDCEFSPPTTEYQLESSERELGAGLPDDLRSLLSETNGVTAEYGVALIWPIERILNDNMAFRSNPEFRELYMPFEPLLFFADAGNGDQFGFSVLAGCVRRTDVFTWNHEDDSRTWVAPTLARYLEGWLSGQINL